MESKCNICGESGTHVMKAQTEISWFSEQPWNDGEQTVIIVPLCSDNACWHTALEILATQRILNFVTIETK